ncbi:MAG: ribose transport system ATP-binding protein [Actinomycetota bacterium]|jgi:ABC-type sugar transport system ATPase subunit|nr:ribose transport system ATP-binding protein [Actinomycetota bacterium]
MTFDTSPDRLISLRGIGKRYGSVDVLREIDIDLDAGECLGLVGENGAGKSTLLGIVSGKTPPTWGTILMGGEERAFRSPREARAAGIEIIPQELAYIPHLSVAENLLLANWPRGRTWVSQRALNREGDIALERLGLSIDVRRRMTELSLAERQLVEIAKALLGNARLLILDEPTASLHARESEFLMGKLHQLKANGVCLIYVSHHLDETFEVSDRIAVLRNGALEDLSMTASTTLDRTVSLMLGSDQAYGTGTLRPEPQRLGQPIELRGWNTPTQPVLVNCDLDLHPGEVLGLFGLVGSGAESVARGLGGHQSDIAGSVSGPTGVSGVPRSPRAARAMQVAYVPAERKSDGLALNQTVAENLTVMVLNRFSGFASWLKRRGQLALSKSTVESSAVRCQSVLQEVGQLSGGNQQKVLLASRLLAEPAILVLHEPTRGVDIGSRNQIHAQLTDYARAGGAVLLVTSDVQEAIDATDRLLVMRDGRVVDELSGIRKTKNLALSTAAGSAA